MSGHPTPKTFHLDRRTDVLIEYGRLAGAPDDWLTTKQLAHWLGYAVGTLELMRMRGIGPPFTKRSGRVLYRRSDVVQWLLERRHQSTAEYRKPRSNGAAAQAVLPAPKIGYRRGDGK
jgi:hypothetical protein